MAGEAAAYVPMRTTRNAEYTAPMHCVNMIMSTRTVFHLHDSIRMLTTRVKLVPPDEMELTDAVSRWMLHILYAINTVTSR